MPGGVEEKLVFPLAHVARVNPNSYYVASAGRVLELGVLGKGLNPEHVSKVANRRFEPTCFCKGNKKCHHDEVRVRGKLEQGNIKELKDIVDERVK